MGQFVSRRERGEQVALWRYQVIRDAIEECLTPKQRGQVVRSIAAASHPGVNGGSVMISRETVDRWVAAWRRGGFEALRPKDKMVASRTPVEVLELAASLKKERPERTASQVKRIIERLRGDAPSESTLLRYFRKLGLPLVHQVVTGRFEADFNNEIWVGDFLHGPMIGGRKTYLAAFLDDHSRYCVSARWALSEDLCRLSIALKPGLLAWGVPINIYVDNGSAFKDDQLARACARMGVRLVHSAPYRPQGRGKIERFFNTVTSQFLSEIDPDGKTGTGTRVDNVQDLDRLFHAWLETVYHASINETTGQTPQTRWTNGWATEKPRRADSKQISQAFLWTATRTVTKAATVQLFNNVYQVDALLTGRKIELTYDPYDLSGPLQVNVDNLPHGQATFLVISRHSHPKAAKALKDEQPASPSGPATGIDYLRLVETDHHARLASKGIKYFGLEQDMLPS